MKKLTTILLLAALLIPVAADAAETYSGDKREGLYQWWHDNGQLKYEDTFVDGKLDGLGHWWDDNGQLKSEHCFRAGTGTDMSYCKKEQQQ